MKDISHIIHLIVQKIGVVHILAQGPMANFGGKGGAQAFKVFVGGISEETCDGANCSSPKMTIWRVFDEFFAKDVF